jgi:hypothetical protein
MDCVKVRDEGHFESALKFFYDAPRVFHDLQTFRSKTLDKTEDECVSKCTEKFLKLNKRAGFRFAEHNFAGSTDSK